MSKNNSENGLLKGFLIFVIIFSLSILIAVIVIDNTSLKQKLIDSFTVDEILLEKKVSNEDTVQVKNKSQLDDTQQTLLQTTTKQDESYLDDILFIGDSRTVGLVNMGFVSENNVLAEVGLAHPNALSTSYDQGSKSYTIKQYLSKNSPRVIMIGFGINGISYLDEEKFMEEYSYLIDTIMSYSPNSKIVIESILPVGKTQENKDSRYNNDKVQEYNELLFEMCEEKGIYYLNLYERLIDNTTEYLDTEYDSGDGLHFNKTAYEEIIDYILTHTI